MTEANFLIRPAGLPAGSLACLIFIFYQQPWRTTTPSQLPLLPPRPPPTMNPMWKCRVSARKTPRGLGGVRDTSCAQYLFARWSTKICGPYVTKGTAAKKANGPSESHSFSTAAHVSPPSLWVDPKVNSMNMLGRHPEMWYLCRLCLTSLLLFCIPTPPDCSAGYCCPTHTRTHIHDHQIHT